MWPGVRLVSKDRVPQQHGALRRTAGVSRVRSLPTTAPGKLRPYQLALLLPVAAIERRCGDDRAGSVVTLLVTCCYLQSVVFFPIPSFQYVV